MLNRRQDVKNKSDGKKARRTTTQPLSTILQGQRDSGPAHSEPASPSGGRRSEAATSTRTTAPAAAWGSGPAPQFHFRRPPVRPTRERAWRLTARDPRVTPRDRGPSREARRWESGTPVRRKATRKGGTKLANLDRF